MTYIGYAYLIYGFKVDENSLKKLQEKIKDFTGTEINIYVYERRTFSKFVDGLFGIIMQTDCDFENILQSCDIEELKRLSLEKKPIIEAFKDKYSISAIDKEPKLYLVAEAID